MSKLGFVLKDVTCSTMNDTKGDLIAVGYAYSVEDKQIKSCPDNMGLVLHFRPYSTGIAQYVKSLVLLPKEVDNMLNYEQRIVRDLGYIMSYNATSLDVFDLGSYSVGVESRSNLFDIFTVGQSQYFIELGAINENSARRQKFAKRINLGYLVGFEHLIYKALDNPVESDFLVPSTLDSEIYLMSLED